MKSTYILFLLVIISLTSTSCSDDKIDSGNDQPINLSANKWIENTMRDNYYWYEEIPNSNKLNFQTSPDVFFTSLLSDKDGKMGGNSTQRHYSTILNTNNTTRSSLNNGLSLGFEFQAYYTNTKGAYALQVLYILPDSPASKSSLKRGDWIFSVDGAVVSDEGIEKIDNGANVKLGVSEMSNLEISKVVTLSGQSILDNPVFFSNIYRYGDKKIGYLTYNHFTAGIDENNSNDETFNNSLRQVFADLKKEMPNEFILDLRYNGGGVVTSAQLLATMLAPASALGDIFCKINYNDKKSSKNYDLKLDVQYMKRNVAGENLDLSRLFVITSVRTASASEAVINSLKPYMGNNLIIVGEKTEGKNVGSQIYTDKRYGWELHPIVCGISNKNNSSDYVNGFLPNFECSEPLNSLKELGDPNEYILSRIINLIVNNEPIVSDKRSSVYTAIPMGSSLDKKRTNGMIMPKESITINK